MTTPDLGTEEGWATLLELSEEERIAQMVVSYTEIAELEPEARSARLAAQVHAVYSRPDEDVRVMTESRLKAWLQMDPEKAATVGMDFESGMNALPADTAMRRVALVQSVASRLTMEEQNRLRQMVPGVMGDEPVRIVNPPRPEDREPDPSASSRPWWAFWRR